jgi:ABC-2 type transport system ATP-binding protein
VLDRIKAPTLLIQGQADSLFPLSEGEANYRGIAANGTPIRVDWFTGGHDGGAGPVSDQNRLKYLTITWLDYYLKGAGDNPGTGFTFSRVTGFDAETRRLTTSGFRSDAFPDSSGAGPGPVTVAGRPSASPTPGRQSGRHHCPARRRRALASLLSGAASRLARAARGVLPSTPSSTGRRRHAHGPARAASPTGSAVLFVKLYDGGPELRAACRSASPPRPPGQHAGQHATRPPR